MPLNRPTNYLLRSARSTEFTNTTLEPIREETIHQEVQIEIHQKEQQVMNNIPVANNDVNLSSVLVKPNRYNIGCTKPDIWLKQFNRWKRLQNLSNEQACNAISFYLEGSSKLWYEGITDEIQNDFDALQNALIERFKNAYEDDDILLAQLPTEKAVEYLDRLQIKERHQYSPGHLLIRIAKKGLKSSLRSIIIQRDPKTLEELKTAAIIAEKCSQEKSQEDSQVNAISNNDFQMLNDTIKALSKKVENGLVIDYSFLIIYDMQHPLILGDDFLLANKANIHYPTRTLYLHEGTIQIALISTKQVNTARNFKTVSVPGLNMCEIPVIIPKHYLNKPVILEPHDYLDKHQLMGACCSVQATRLSTSPYNSAVVLVKKKDNSFRMTIDYSKINAVSEATFYTPPNLNGVFGALGAVKPKKWSSLDCANGYWQIGLHPNSRHKSAFVTHNGVYEWNRMPFWLKISGFTFQMVVSQVLQGLNWKHVLVYVDDILIFSKNFEDHLTHLTQVFTPILAFPDLAKPFTLTCDALGSAIGYILGQVDDNKRERVISFGGRALKNEEKNWTISEKECLAVLEGIKHNNVYLSNHKFKVFTYHKALIWLHKTKDTNAKLGRWLCNYKTMISKSSIRKEIAKLQRQCSKLSDLIKFLETGKLPDDEKKAKTVYFDKDNYRLGQHGELIHQWWPRKKGVPRAENMIEQLVLPKILREDALLSFHDCKAGDGHTGIKKTYAALHLKYFWPGMYQQVYSQYVTSCDECQRAKRPAHKQPAPLMWLIPLIDGIWIF
ncbi:unnamed protein product [Mytilus coruscus]|uniref:RNA-directed DNA polymerase n=1 Tax=Mytilus coruscus TaxID=42192 RepID=A0A6J8B862_MYTCO|nr:unnamed protein product [Mytilus coruscus]